MLLHTPVSIGEVIDKITILDIKSERIKCEEKLQHIHKELKYLKDLIQQKIKRNAELDKMWVELKGINELLWDIEDAIRIHEKHKNFNEDFIDLARKVYFTNDKLAKKKYEINMLLGSAIVEVKSYEEYCDN